MVYIGGKYMENSAVQKLSKYKRCVIENSEELDSEYKKSYKNRYWVALNGIQNFFLIAVFSWRLLLVHNIARKI